MSHTLIPSFVLLMTSLCSIANPFPMAQDAQAFVPLEHWRTAVLAGDAATLKSFYSVARPLKEMPPPFKTAEDDVNFWTQWKSKGLADLSLEISSQKHVADVQILIIQAELSVREETGLRKYYVVMGQGWEHHGDDWSIGTVSRESVTKLKVPSKRLHLYVEDANARGEIAKAVLAAGHMHKRVNLIFGNSICTNCDVLEAAFKSPEIAGTFDRNYELVHIYIGALDKNLDVAKQYGVPLPQGFPALAVLDSNGELVFSQKQGEFADARWMAPEDILAFLNKWKPSATKN
jgi:thioredoxin 1